MNDTTDNTTQTTEAVAPELTISDLQNIRTILDVATRRGAFAAPEMSSIGSVYDKLNTFLMSVLPAPQENVEPTQETTENTTGE